MRSKSRLTSSALTPGPRSLISVCSPEVGSITARLIRVSAAILVKSVSTDSSCSCSSTRDPVGPPTKPVAITGRPSRLSARATLIPLPPATVRLSTARWRRPRRKLGTATVRSIAAFKVTVRITWPSPESAPTVVSAGQPAQQRSSDHEYHERRDSDRDQVVRDGRPGAVEEARFRDRAAGAQGDRTGLATVDEDDGLAQLGSAADRSLDLPRGTHPQVELLTAADADLERSFGAQRQLAAGVANFG